MTPAQYALWVYWWEHAWGWTAWRWERWLSTGYGVRRVVHLTETQAGEALARLREELPCRG